MAEPSYKANKITVYFFKLCKLIYLAGFPNFWMEDLDYSKWALKLFGYGAKLINGILYLFIVFEWAAVFTQHNLSEKQSSDSILFNYSHPILFSYRLIITHHQKKMKTLVYWLLVKLKEVYNDEKVERDMIWKSKLYSISFSTLCSMSLLFYGFDGLFLIWRKDATFTTVITAWPDVEDKSVAASAVRVINYIFWWLFMSRVFGSYALMLTIIIALEHQYKNLRKYFLNLRKIFKEDLSQAQMEDKYEEQMKIGIGLHSDTLMCTKLAQDTCSTIYCLQILLNISVLVTLLAQTLNSERTVGGTITTVCTAAAMLFSTGFFMWTAGDVTVEASNLSTDIYLSGWHNCYKRSVSVRKLLTVAIAQAQKPVMIKGLGVIKISYRAYLSIVRSSYSIFTVLY